MQLCEKKVCDVSCPHLDANCLSLNKMVVDVRIEDGTTYTIPDTCEIAYVGTKVIATDKRLLVNEVESIKTTSEKALAEVDKHKETIEKCDALMLELSPIAKERKETDERLTKLEGTVGDIHTMLTEINNRLMTKI